MPSALLERLALPDRPRVVFDRPPLVLALCQVQFEPVLGIAREAVVEPFQHAIRGEYPRVQRFKQFDLQIEAGPAEEPQLVERTARPPAWRFSDVPGNWTVVLAKNFVTLEARAYERFEEFVQRLADVVRAVVTHIEPTVGTRLGLRYVNEIRLTEWNAEDVVHRELLGPLAVPEIERHAAQAIQQLLLRFPDHEGINIGHGRLASGSTVQGSGDEPPKEGPFYLLDFDVFREFPAPAVLWIEPELICRYVETYHTAIYRLFRWAVTPEYVEARQTRQAAGAKAAPPATRERVIEVAPQFTTQAEAISRLRRAGLKVEQLMRVMGVSRQTIYNWGRGARIDSQHLERLMRVREIVERARRHYAMPEDLESWLVTPQDRDGVSPLDLMAAGDFARARFFAISAPATRVRPIEALRDRPVAEKFRREREMRFRAEPPEDDEELGALLAPDDEEDEESGTGTGRAVVQHGADA